MNITSTEFQQNVGYYLKQAEKGKTITIKKLKPKKSTYILVVEHGEKTTKAKPSRREEIMKLIDELDMKDTSESGLEFQRRVRS